MGCGSSSTASQHPVPPVGSPRPSQRPDSLQNLHPAATTTADSDSTTPPTSPKTSRWKSIVIERPQQRQATTDPSPPPLPHFVNPVIDRIPVVSSAFAKTKRNLVGNQPFLHRVNSVVKRQRAARTPLIPHGDILTSPPPCRQLHTQSTSILVPAADRKHDATDMMAQRIFSLTNCSDEELASDGDDTGSDDDNITSITSPTDVSNVGMGGQLDDNSMDCDGDQPLPSIPSLLGVLHPIVEHRCGGTSMHSQSQSQGLSYSDFSTSKMDA